MKYTYEELINRFINRTNVPITKDFPEIPYVTKYEYESNKFIYITNSELESLKQAKKGILIPSFYDNTDLEIQYITMLEEYYKVRIFYYLLRAEKNKWYNLAKQTKRNGGYQEYNQYLKKLNTAYNELKLITAKRVNTFERLRATAKKLREETWTIKREYNQDHKDKYGIRIKKDGIYSTVDPSVLSICLDRGWILAD